MSKKKKKKRLSAAKDSPPPELTDGESRQSVALTVAWMLALLVTVASELIAIPAVIIARNNPAPPRIGFSLGQIGELFLFISLVTGLVCAGLVPVVYRVRALPPPRAVAITALVAGVIPPVTIILRWLL